MSEQQQRAAHAAFDSYMKWADREDPFRREETTVTYLKRALDAALRAASAAT